MLGMIMMVVGMTVVGITFDGYKELIGVLAIHCFISEELGRWKWNHDTLAAAISSQKSMRSLKSVAFEEFSGRLLQSPLAWPGLFGQSLVMAHSVLSDQRPFSGESQLTGSYQHQPLRVLWVHLLFGPLELRSRLDGLSIYEGQMQVPVLLLLLSNVLLVMLLFAHFSIYNEPFVSLSASYFLGSYSLP